MRPALLALVATTHFVIGLPPSTSVAALVGGDTLGVYTTDDVGYVRFESDRTGLFTVSTLTIAPCPDLTVMTLELTPTVPACGDSVKVRALVRNIGGASAPSPGYNLTFDGVVRVSGTLSTLAAGAETWTPKYALGIPTTGNHTLTVCVDPQGYLREENENNNCR